MGPFSRAAIFAALALVPAVAAVVSCCGKGAEGGPADAPARVDGGEGEPAASPGTRTRGHGDILVLGIRASGAEQLDGKAAQALWLEWLEAVAADGMAWDAAGPRHRRAKEMLDQIVLNDAGIPASIIGRIRRYAAAFTINHGPVDRGTGKRTRPRFIPGELAAAAQGALMNGAAIEFPAPRGGDLGATRVQELEELLRLVGPVIFGDRGLARQGAGEGDGVPDGGPAGEEASAAPDGPVGGVAGFTPPEWARRIAALEKTAAVLDRRVRAVGGEKSVAGRLVRARVEPIVAIDATGDYGPAMPAGTDLLWTGPVAVSPIGGRHRYLLNADAALEEEVGARIVREFSADPDAAARRARCRSTGRPALQILREAVGRGLDGTEKKPHGWLAGRLGAADPVVEEMRADLAALYLAADRELIAAGLLPDDECALAFYEDYVTGALEMAAAGMDREGPGHAARMAVVGLLVRSGAAALARDGAAPDRTVIRVVDAAAARAAVAEALAEVRRVRFVGDGGDASALVAAGGAWLPAETRRELRERWSALGIPRSIAFLYPVPKGPPAEGSALLLEAPIDVLDRMVRVRKVAGALADATR